MHSFHERLNYSEAAQDEPFWDIVYRKQFPTLVNHMPTGGDTESQRMGIDRVLLLSSGQVLRIEEKKREQDFGDVLLEYIANDRSGTPGWIEKDLAADYLAYAFMPSQRCLFFAWPLLRRAWELYGEGWKTKYPTVRARNRGYDTLSVAVPTGEVRRGVAWAGQVVVTEADWKSAGVLPEEQTATGPKTLVLRKTS